MKYCLLLLLTGLLYGPVTLSAQTKNGMPGVYVSRAPNAADKLGIMYPKFYFNFLYNPPGQETLTLKGDMTFTLTLNGCKGKTTDMGTWKESDGKIILDYQEEGRDDEAFIKYQGDELYYIRRVTLSETKEVMPNLTLLKKQ